MTPPIADEKQSRELAWKEHRASLDRDGKWTAGETGNFYAFFLAGWNAAALQAARPIVGEDLEKGARELVEQYAGCQWARGAMPLLDEHTARIAAFAQAAADERDARIIELERRLRIPFGKLPCAQCGGPHDFDTSVPSVVWNRIIRAKGLPEYLCTTCIVREFVRVGEGFTAELYSEEFHGVPIEVVVNGQNANVEKLVEAAADAARKDERTRCVKIVESFASDIHMEMTDASEIATAIRNGEESDEGPTGCMDDNDELSQALRGVSQQELNRILKANLK